MIPIRPNKLAQGLTAHNERNKKRGGKTFLNLNSNPDLLTLSVRGTLDVFARRQSPNALSKRVYKEHPIDKGYFKEVFILSNYGKHLLKMKRKRYENHH